MNQKIKTIIIGILIGLIAFPTFTLGGTFVVSLIQGKTVEEAVQILAGQIDALIGRVEKIEIAKVELKEQQVRQELWREKEQACKHADELNYSIPPVPEGVEQYLADTAASCAEFIQRPGSFYIWQRPRSYMTWPLDTVEEIYNWIKTCPEHPDLKVIRPAYEKYLKARQRCDELIAQGK